MQSQRRQLIMSGRYTRMATRMWADEKFRELTEEARYLFIYILTSPHSNMIGYYVLPKPYVLHDLQWSDKQLAKSFTELLDQGLIFYCERSSVVLIPNYLKYNTISNENMGRAAEKQFEDLPRNGLVNEFLSAMKRLAEPFAERFAKRFAKRFDEPFAERYTERYGKSDTDTDTETVSETDTGEERFTQPFQSQDKEDSAEAEVVFSKNGKKAVSMEKINEVMTCYNEAFSDLWSRPLSLTNERKGQIRARLQKYSVDELKTAINRIRGSPFHCGENDRKWVASPEFLFRNDTQVDRFLARKEVKTNGPDNNGYYHSDMEKWIEG